MTFFKHETACVESEAIGQGTRIGAFNHILAGARIGERCTLSDRVTVEGNVEIGDRVTIGNGVCLLHGARVMRDALIGDNCTIVAGVRIGDYARVSPGAVVTLDVPPHAIVTGNPARIVGYEDVPFLAPAQVKIAENDHGSRETAVGGVRFYRLPYVEDLRGYLSFAEIGQHLPFLVKRYFVVFDVASREIRGEHAHRKLEQFLVSVHGSCQIIADDGDSREEYLLDRPNLGLYIPPMVWCVQYKYSRDGVLLVLASERYDAADYIRDYHEFKSLVKPA
jgi:carbonic anhydrase/acetyltransferase-like protein (isoleucine patch superfamily)